LHLISVYVCLLTFAQAVHHQKSRSSRFVSKRRKSRDRLQRDLHLQKNGVSNSGFNSEPIKVAENNSDLQMKQFYPKQDEKVEEHFYETAFPEEQDQNEYEVVIPTYDNVAPSTSTPEKVSDKESLSSENESKKMIIEEQTSIHSLQNDVAPMIAQE